MTIHLNSYFLFYWLIAIVFETIFVIIKLRKLKTNPQFQMAKGLMGASGANAILAFIKSPVGISILVSISILIVWVVFFFHIITLLIPKKKVPLKPLNTSSPEVNFGFDQFKPEDNFFEPPPAT